MSKFQVKYHGDDWEEVDENRVYNILSDHYKDSQAILNEMEQGLEVRTTFATYRVETETKRKEEEEGEK